MIPSRKGVEVWMANQPTGRSLLRQLIVDERAGTPNEGLVALQTAELLRTTLLSRSEVATNPAPRPPPPAPPPQITTPAQPTTFAGLQAGYGALWSPGAGNLATQVWVTINRSVYGPFGLALDGSAPITSATITGPEGSASVRAWLIGATVFVRHELPTSGLYASLAAGAAAMRVTFAGSVSGPFVASSPTTSTGAVYLRGDAGFAVARWLRFGGRAVAGAIPTGVSVRFAGNEAAVWGRPFLAGLVLADLSWR